MMNDMKKILFCLMTMLLLSLTASAQMSDDKVMEYIKTSLQSGKTQGQVTAQLMQKGVQIEQIRRIRNKYKSDIAQAGLTKKADAAVEKFSGKNNAPVSKDTRRQEITAGRVQGDVAAKQSDESYVRMMRDEEVEKAIAEEEAAQSINDNKGKRVFGRDIFNNKLLSFEPSMNIATPSDYVLGPGDVVIINIYGGSQSSNNYVISNDGSVTVPGYGPIDLSGLTVAGANDKLRRTLGSRFQSSEIKTSVSKTRSIRVNVMGEVKVPGTYTLSAFATVFHALYMAGGINGLGTLRNIKVYRGGSLITVVDVYEYIMNGRLAGNVRLQDNDVIIVSPYDCLVDITGAVKRPMCYEMRRNESLSTLVKYAGSWSNYAYKKQVRILRVNGEQKQVFNVDEFDMSSFKVMDGDAVSVDSILDRYENMVEVKGAVFRPGLYQLGAQINTVRSLVEQAQGLTEDAYAKHAVIHRLKDDRTKTVLAIDLEAIMNDAEADIPLKNEDVLFIPTEASKTKKRTLTIHGEVQFPGTYEYAEHQTVEDFIVQAGGLTDAASIAKVDVSRRILDPMATAGSMVLAKTYSFKLENGLIINKDADFFLEPYDEVYVRRSPGFETQRHVTIDGEANFPGEYTLKYKNMRLTELVNMAGGLTKNAYVRGARILRVMNEEEKIRRNAVFMISEHNLSKRDSVKLSGLQMDDTYYVGIDLEKALKDSLCAENITLREGDRLFIPEYNPTVRISGDVMYPNSVAYEPGKSLDYYIKQAGGYGNRARSKRAFVVYQNGKVGDRKAPIEAGSEIVVPSKPEYKGLSVGNILGIVTAVLSFATIMISAFK